ncbi:MAG: (d)CMP kinase [Francisellaceae bacterium]|nr:(d)CMP kinase [Francisellaceae bacterium]
MDTITPPPVITIDGPSGTGKGTLSLLLAKALKWHYLDSGALYRILGLLALEQNLLEPLLEASLINLALNLDLQFIPHPNYDSPQIYLKERDITSKIREERVGMAASKLASSGAIRAALLERQKTFLKAPGLVADGRDMGTIVFPEAKFKFYLIADPLERAKRRYLQLKEQGQDVNLQHLLHAIRKRDKQDEERAIAPLKPAEDAYLIDTTGLSIQAVFETLMKRIDSC